MEYSVVTAPHIRCVACRRKFNTALRHCPYCQADAPGVTSDVEVSAEDPPRIVVSAGSTAAPTGHRSGGGVAKRGVASQTVEHVNIVGVDVSIGDLMVLLLKLLVAAIPVVIILGILQLFLAIVTGEFSGQ